MWTARPAWWHAEQRLAQYADAFREIADELHAGRCWRSALSELDELHDQAVHDRLCIERDPAAPAAVLCQCADVWPAILGALTACETLLEAAQRGHVRTEKGIVLHILVRAEFAEVAEAVPCL
jgi:hypothetical protein